jgi:hypothetical protein
LIKIEVTMTTIERAASEHRWEDAVLSLCNALEALPSQRRLAVGREVINLCNTVKLLLMSACVPATAEPLNKPISLAEQPQRSEFEPVEVQLEGANEILAELDARRKEQDQESVLKLASAISSAIFAVQILMWIKRNPDDFRKWQRDEVPDHGVYDDPVANSVGEILWKQVHSIILQEKTFRRRSEDFIYQARPIQALARSWLDEQLL